MAQMADITVKKADETTDIVYSQIVPSAGDKTAALWKCTSVGSAPGHNPRMSLVSRDNAAKTARRVAAEFAYPWTAIATDGSVQIIDTFRFSGSYIVPQGMPQDVINEATAQCNNLLAAVLIKNSIKSGYAPT